MNVHLLGLLGLIVLKVKFLEVLKRVCECQICLPMEGARVDPTRISSSLPHAQPIP